MSRADIKDYLDRISEKFYGGKSIINVKGSKYKVDGKTVVMSAVAHDIERCVFNLNMTYLHEADEVVLISCNDLMAFCIPTNIIQNMTGYMYAKNRLHVHVFRSKTDGDWCAALNNKLSEETKEPVLKSISLEKYEKSIATDEEVKEYAAMIHRRLKTKGMLLFD